MSPAASARSRFDSERQPSVGRYRESEELARGGMGVVYRVFDTYVERELALKRLLVRHEPTRPRLIALFENEFETLAQLAHPGIVEAYEYGVDAAGPYYTMELLSGGDLARAAPMSVAETCRVVRDVASALALVHTRGFVYRDLSPTNVRLTERGRAKLIDFGALTPFGVPREIVGTAAFMAPECLHRDPLDARTDLYAVGALLYWCLTRTHAVHARVITDLLEALSYPVRPPSELAPEVPAALDELVLALLSHDPLARPGSAAEVMDRLTAIGTLAPEPDTERVAASYLTHPPLVGRGAQLQVLLDRFEQAQQGRGQGLLLEAPRGLGRTALVGQLTRHVQRAGASVLRAQSSAQGGPLSVMRPLVRAALATEPRLAQAHPLAAQLCTRDDAALGQARSASGAAEQQARVIASVQACLLEFTTRTPTVLVVDDAHRADAESLGLLVLLAHEARGQRLLVVATSANDEPPAHAHAHARLVEETTRVALTPLDAEHLATLTTTIFGPVPNQRRLSMWLHQHGGGNPARCIALARGLLQQGAIHYVTGSFSLPYDLPDDVLTRLDVGSGQSLEGLSAQARASAELLSLYDEAVSLEQLAESAQQSKKTLVLALEELIKRNIVRRVDERFSFADEALRAAVLQAIEAPRLRELRLRAARALLETPCASLDARRQAGHLLLQTDACDEGLRLLTGLASELSRSPEALGKAVPALEAALALRLQRKGSTALRMPLLVPLALAGYYRDPRLLGLYVTRALENLQQITGARLAQRLRRFIGSRLAFVIGLLYARVYYGLVKAQLGPVRFLEVFAALFGVAGTSAAAACAAFDFELAQRMGEALESFAPLGPQHPANLVREYCTTTARARIGPLAASEASFGKLTERLSSPGAIAGMDEEVRVQLLVGTLYVSGMVKLLHASADGLAIADRMDAQQRAFYRPHAELLRMLHFAMRGEQHLAEPHRERTELLALLGGSGWSAVNNTAHRSILIYQWTQDSMNLLRVIADLKRFAPVNAAVEPHIQLAEAYVELLRGHPERAKELYEQVFSGSADPRFWTWTSERGRYAEALNHLGQHAEARRVCEDALSRLEPDERAYPFLAHVVEQQLALAEAQLGETGAAAARLDRLIEEVSASQNPLLIGSLHRDRASVARIAHDAPAFELHAGAMSKWFRVTKNPALIQQCERCASDGQKAGLTVPWGSTTQLLDPLFAQSSEQSADAQECTAFVSEAEAQPRRNGGPASAAS